MAATKIGIQTQPSATYLSEVALGQSPVFLAQNSNGTTDTGSSAVITITPSVPTSKFNMPWTAAEPIATTHTIQAGSSGSTFIVSPALSFPDLIGTADYTGKGFTVRFPAGAVFTPLGSAFTITSNTGTTQLNLASAPPAGHNADPNINGWEVGDTIEVHSGYEFGALSAKCVAGVATFPTFSISGNAATTLNATSSGLTGITTNAIANSGTYYRGAELPRVTHDTTYPTVIGATLTVGPGKTYTSVQAAYLAAVALNRSDAVELLIDPGTYAEQIQLKPKSNPGEIIFRRAGSHVVAAGTRVKPSDFASGGVKISVENSRGVVQCDAGACYVRFCGIEICQPVPAGGTATDLISVLYLYMKDTDDQTVAANYPHHIIVDRCYVHGGTGIELRKGITLGGGYQSVVDSDVRDIFNLTASQGGVHLNGDTNAIGAFYSPGPHLFRNSHFNAAGEIILFGGSDPPIKGLVPSDVTIQNCYVEKPLSWKGVYQAKNTFEYKNVRRLLVENCVFDGSWADAQDGTGMLLNTANQGGLPAYGFEGVRDVVIRKSFIRNMTAAFTLIGQNYFYGYLQRRLVLEHVTGVNIHGAEPGGTAPDINRLFYLGKSLADVVIDHVTMLAAPGVSTMALYLETPASPRSDVTNSIMTCSSYGVFATTGLAGTSALSSLLPDATFAKNLCIDRVFADGNSYPASSYYPPTNADVGFTDLSQINSFNSLDPDTVCAALALSGASTYKGVGTGSTDPGADMAVVRAAIAGVLTGGATGATPTQLLLSTPPAGAVSGMTLTTQPAGTVADSGGSTVTSDTSTVTASWVLLTGDAVPTGTLTTTASSGAWAFTTLGLSWSSPSTGYWHFTDGALTAVNSATMILPVATPTASLVLPTVVDQWRPTQRNREGLEVVPSASPLIGTGGTTVQNSATTAVLIPVGRVKVSVLSLSLDAMTAAGSAGTVTVQAFKVSGGVSSALTTAQSIKSDVISASGNIVLPVLTSLFDGASNGTRRIDGTRGDTLRVDIVASGTITQQPQVRVVAELAVNG